MGKNGNCQEFEIVESDKYAMRINRGDKSIEFSPEISQQICNEMISLGTQFIAERSKLTIEYFKTQADMYYAQLNAYISKKAMNSEERKIILKKIEEITDTYIVLINKTEDMVKKEHLIHQYERFIDKHSQLYIQALKVDTYSDSPQKPNLLGGLRKFFLRG